jgi:hypothetical protein
MMKSDFVVVEINEEEIARRSKLSPSERFPEAFAFGQKLAEEHERRVLELFDKLCAPTA